MPLDNQGEQGQDMQRGRPSGRGFAGMDREKQREIASKGGRAAHAQGTAHEFTSEEAREAGRKGGEASHGGRGARRNTSASGGSIPRVVPGGEPRQPSANWDTGTSGGQADTE